MIQYLVFLGIIFRGVFGLVLDLLNFQMVTPQKVRQGIFSSFWLYFIHHLGFWYFGGLFRFFLLLNFQNKCLNLL